MQAYSNSIILNDVRLTIMVPDCFIMSEAPYYLDICIVHNLYPPPLTLPLPLPFFCPNKQNSSILDKLCNPYCPISEWRGGGTLVS